MRDFALPPARQAAYRGRKAGGPPAGEKFLGLLGPMPPPGEPATTDAAPEPVRTERVKIDIRAAHSLKRRSQRSTTMNLTEARAFLTEQQRELGERRRQASGEFEVTKPSPRTHECVLDDVTVPLLWDLSPVDPQVLRSDRAAWPAACLPGRQVAAETRALWSKRRGPSGRSMRSLLGMAFPIAHRAF